MPTPRNVNVKRGFDWRIDMLFSLCAQRIPLVIVFTGVDEFKSKLKSVPLYTIHSDFEGTNDVKSAANFIVDAYLNKIRRHLQYETVHPFMVDVTGM